MNSYVLQAVAAGLGFTCLERLLTVGPAGSTSGCHKSGWLAACFHCGAAGNLSSARPQNDQRQIVRLLYCYGFFSRVLHYYGAMFLLWELSTPFVYARWFLHKAGMSRTTAYKVNGVLMVLVFFLCRNVAGLVCSVDFFRETSPELQHPTPGGLSPAAIWLYRGLNLPLNALNAFWLYKMLTGALKVLKQAPSNIHKADDHKRN
ncbi:hypothetical protein WJX77_004744 [Trebouxia sp. C0004]